MTDLNPLVLDLLLFGPKSTNFSTNLRKKIRTKIFFACFCFFFVFCLLTLLLFLREDVFRYAGVCVKEAEKGWCLASSRFDQGLKEPGSKVRGFLFLCVRV